MSSTAIYRAFIRAGVDEELATLASKDVIGSEQTATKSDLAEVKGDLIKWMAGFFLANTVVLVTIMGIIFQAVV